MPTREISVLVFPVGGEPRLQMVVPELEPMQALVGGHLQPARLSGRVCLYCNEDGLRLRLDSNRWVPGVGDIVGQFILAASAGSEWVSLTEEEAVEWTRQAILWPVAGLDYEEVREGGRFGG